MKKYADIEQAIRANGTRLNDLEQIIGAAKWSERNAPEIVAARAEADLLKIENKILHDNARRAYFAEVIPAVVAAFQQYKGKAYGEKTKEKIKAECKARVGCAAHIGYKYSTTELVLVPLDKNGFSGTGMFRYDELNIRMKYHTTGGDGRKLLEDNKIQEFSADDLYICDCPEYVEDVRAHAELIKMQFTEVKKTWEAYDTACSAFNRLVPSGIEHANPYSSPRGYLI